MKHPKTSPTRRRGAVVVLLLVSACSLSSAERQSLRGQVPAAVAGLQSSGRLAGSKMLDLALELPLRNKVELASLLRQLYDPGSPNFHRYLTPEEFTARFGPTERDYQQLQVFAQSSGLEVRSKHPNRLLLDVRGRVADIEKALHVVLRLYQHPTEPRQFYAPDVEPSVALAVPLMGISGLNDYSRPRPRLRATPLNKTQTPTLNSGSGPSGTYMGNDFRAAYLPGSSLTGSGQVVGLVQFDGYDPADIAYYEASAGLPSVTLSNVLLDGFNGRPNTYPDYLEVDLDIQMVISMAPGLSEIIVYEAGPFGIWHDVLNRMATDNLAKQLSCSWGGGAPNPDPVADQIFQQMAAQGQSFFQASGDSDAYTGPVDFPSDNPYITQVGGTTLTTTGPGGSWVSEQVWNWGGGVGSGGGFSTVYAIPAWQQGVSMAANQGSTTQRNLPDVALIADQVYVRATGIDFAVGGTSCAAPLWAGLTALINEQAVTTGRTAIGFINPVIYRVGAGTNYTSAFHDITLGDNTGPASPFAFHAVAGYDLCTGWGTPAGMGLIMALEPLVILHIPSNVTEGDGLLAGAGQLRLPFVATNNVTVTLACSDTAQIQVPSSATIPAGQSIATFDLTILDDGVLDGTQIATVAASVPGLGTDSENMTIYDKETATLELVLPPAVGEGQAAQGMVHVSAVPAANVSVLLSSSDISELTVPATVTMPAGQTSTVFTAMGVADNQLKGPRTVTVAAHVQNWTDGVASIVVTNNKPWTLAVSLPASAWEYAGVLTNAGTVSILGTLRSDLVVSLTSGNPSKLIVPATVTIPAGQLTNTFSLGPVDDSFVEGHQTVVVAASAPEFTNGSASILILDKESPLPPFNPRPGNLATDVPANTRLRWNVGTNIDLVVNGGFESGTVSNWAQVTNGGGGHFATDDGTYLPFYGYDPVPPYAGSYSAVAEESGPGAFYMYQDVSIPSGAYFATLSWAHQVRNFASSFSTNQQFQVLVCDTNNVVLATAFTTSPGDPLSGQWSQHEYDLSGFAGQAVRLMFSINRGLWWLDVHLDSISVQVPTLNVTNDIHFGVNPAPGPAEWQGSTTNTAWTLPLLAPMTTYYWQIVAHCGGTGTGAVWQFTTRGADHFVWDAVPSPQLMNKPFQATVAAKDGFNRTVTNFTGPVGVSGVTSLAASGLLADFETGLQGFTINNSVGYGNGFWHLSTGRGSQAGHSTSHSIYYGFGEGSNGGGTYNTTNGSGVGVANEGVITSFPIDLRVVSSPPGLSFNYLIQTDGRAQFGNATVEISTNGGSSFVIIAGNAQGPVRFTNDTGGVWSSAAISLSDYVGSQILVRFHFSTGNGLIALLEGWYVDDIVISGALYGTIAVTPAITGNFTNGLWSGPIGVLAPAATVGLLADDGNGHYGVSAPFSVGPSNDVSLSILDSPHPVWPGTNLTYLLKVANTGPADATGVTVVDILPGGASFISATSSQGTCAQSGGIVTCNLGLVPGGANATVTVVVAPSVAGTSLTNVATVSRAEPDADLGNNTATVITPVAFPPAQLYRFAWNPISSPQPVNGPFAVAITALDYSNNPATNFSGTANLSGSSGGDLRTNTILDNPTSADSVQGSYTLGYAFTPTTNLTVTHLRHYFGTKVSLWTDTGVLLASLNVTNTPGSWGEDALPNPVPLSAGTRYRVGAYSGGSQFFWREDLPSAFPDGTINQSYEFAGDVFPVGPDGERWWLVDLRYTVGSPLYIPPIAPTTSGVFTNGTWTGNVSVETSVTNMVLRADDGNGHSGLSSTFNVQFLPPVIISQPVSQIVDAGDSALLSVAALGTQPWSYQWLKNATNLFARTNATLLLSNVTRLDEGNYSVTITNVFGSATSSNAFLRVLVAQRFTSVSVDSVGTVHLLFGDASGGGLADPANIQVQFATNLLGSNLVWATLGNGLALVTNGLLQVEDTGATNRSQTFYRAVEQP